MRIAVVNNFFPPRPGGSSHLAEHLARRYVEEGHEVIVITAGYRGAPARETMHGVDVHRVPAWTMPKTRLAANFDIAFTISRSSKRLVFALLDEFRPDVIHQHGQFFDLTWITGWWARSRSVATLLSIHTRLYSPNLVNNTIYRLADALLVWPMMRVHRPTLVVMDVLMDRYIGSRYRGAFSGKVDIPVGIDPSALSGGDPKALAHRFPAEDHHIILSLGHVIPQRNRLALIEALPAVLERFSNAKVVVVGEVYYDAFLHRAKALGVDHAVWAPGAVPRSEVPDFLATADLEVHELDGQGFGTASLEALAVGIPVVAAIRTDNFMDIEVVDGRELFLAPFVSARDERADPAGLAAVLISVLERPQAAREQVAEHARRFIDDHFTIERVTERYLEVLASLVRRSA